MRIVIHNFGPIKEADIETKRYTVFIGQTSTGKSVAAKLISIANDLDFLMLKEGDFNGFVMLLARYCIDFAFHADTKIQFFNEHASCIIQKGIVHIDVKAKSPLQTFRLMEIENTEAYNNNFRDIFDDFQYKSVDDIVAKIGGRSFDTELAQTLKRRETIDFTKLSDYQRKLLYLTYREAFLAVNNPVYIPAERILISIFTHSIFSLLQSGTAIPESIKRFGSLYENAKSKIKQFDIDFMNISVNFSKEQDTIHIGEDNVDIVFSQASSGMQSIIPMWSVFCNALNELRSHIVIEEPELNLFPSLQVALITRMIELLNSTKSSLVVTTHSPYILSVFDNLIYAKDVYDRADNAHKEKVAALVKTDSMIAYEDVAAYSFNDNGIITYINDEETRSTGAYALDAASTETANVFNELLAIDNEL